MRRHRRDYEIISEMNLTNLLDTAFVLLITFIIVSPTIRPGLKIDLPQVQRQEEITVNNTKSISIVIKKREMEGLSEPVYVDDTRYSLEENAPDSLKTLIDGKIKQNPKMTIIVEGDKDSTHETFVKVLSILKSLGVENIGIATEAETPDSADKKAKHEKKGKK